MSLEIGLYYPAVERNQEPIMCGVYQGAPLVNNVTSIIPGTDSFTWYHVMSNWGFISMTM